MSAAADEALDLSAIDEVADDRDERATRKMPWYGTTNFSALISASPSVRREVIGGKRIDTYLGHTPYFDETDDPDESEIHGGYDVNRICGVCHLALPVSGECC